MRTRKVLTLVAGGVMGVVALSLFAAAGVLLWAHTTQRDAAGYYATPTQRLTTASYALTSERIDLDRGGWRPLRNIGTARVQARSTTGAAVFVGIARQSDVDTFLAASAHDELHHVRFDPFRPTYVHRVGEAGPGAPGAQTFWAASASGPGSQTVTWDIQSGRWALVIMNADASRGVTVDASAGVKTGLLLPVGFGVLAAALATAAAAVALIVLGAGGRRNAAAEQGKTAEPQASEAAPLPALSSATSYPLRLEGRLDEPLNRGLWLVKWLLVIPHVLILALLWIAFAVLTVVAGAAVLFTGRYPRSIFDFNVGVLRWTWRVTFYAVNLATDRYPPFSLSPDGAYPADLSVDYPERLSQPLVLVKWWLLAIPHYLIISIFGGGITWWLWGVFGRSNFPLGFGLIGVLALVAGFGLAFTGRYVPAIFDFEMGMQRWTYRVWAYAGLLTDAYPPFRLDNGGADPGALSSKPAEPSGPGGSLVPTPEGGRA